MKRFYQKIVEIEVKGSKSLNIETGIYLVNRCNVKLPVSFSNNFEDETDCHVFYFTGPLRGKFLEGENGRTLVLKEEKLIEMSNEWDLVFQKLLTQIRDGPTLEILDLKWSNYGEERVCELVKQLKGNKSVKQVLLSYCGLGPRFACVLSDALKTNQSIVKLELWDNNLGDKGARAIAEALKVNQCVKFLSLGKNSIGSEGARAIGGMLSANKTIKVLDLSRNKIGLEGARAVAEALKVNHIIEVLPLFDNDLGTEGAQEIGEALKVNYSLKELYLLHNNIDAEGARALFDTLQVNGSLITCGVDVFRNDVSAFCKRNVAMHKRAGESVVCLLALRRTGRVTVVPREIMIMIGQMLWRTKCDVEAWIYLPK